MAGNFLADTLAALPPETPAEPEPETTEEETTEEGDDTTPAEEALEPAEGEESEDDSEEEAPTEEAPAVVDESVIDPEKEYTVGDSKLKGKDLADGIMMRADYTRKTQELAEDRKAFEAEAAGLTDYKEAADQWFEAVSDPTGANMYDELHVNFPEVAKALRARIIEEELALVDMTEQAAELYRKNAAREASDRVAARQAEVQGRIRAKREREIKTMELRKTFAGWTEEVMKEVGLDPRDEEQAELVRAAVMKHKGVQWTRDTFLTEAKRIAKIAKVEPPKPATPPKDAKGKFVAAKKADGQPPPVKPQGGRRPASTPARTEKPKPMNSGDFFANLRGR